MGSGLGQIDFTIDQTDKGSTIEMVISQGDLIENLKADNAQLTDSY